MEAARLATASKINKSLPPRSKPSENPSTGPPGGGSGMGAKTAVDGTVKAARRRESGFLKIDSMMQSDPRDEMINDLKEDLNKLQKCCTCVICQDMLYEPYTFQCGHVFCYTCIMDWLRQATSRKRGTCPQCRVPITVRPSPAFLIKDMIETFVYRAEIMASGTAGSEMRKMQREASAAVERDKATPQGLFRGLFNHEAPKRALGIRDAEDDVLRCPECNWEVHGGRCEHCGIRVRELRDGDDLSDESEDDELDYDSQPERWMEDYTEGVEEDEEDEIESESDNSETEWEDEADFEADVVRPNGPGNGRNQPIVLDDDEEEDEQIRQNRRLAAGGPVGFFGARRNHRNIRDIRESDDEDEDSEEDDTEGSLQDFIVDTPESRNAGQRANRGRAVNSRTRMSGPWALSSSSPAPLSPNNSRTSRRPNARRTIQEDDEDEENQSSVSEMSSQPTPSRNHLMLSSDYDEDEEEALLLQQYQPLGGHQTATEDEDDGFSSPPRAGGRRRNFTSNSASTPGSVFSVPEEDEDDQDGDNDDSEDEDGDIRMGDDHRITRRAEGHRATNAQRRTMNGSNRNQPLQVDSGSDSEPIQRRRRPRPVGTATRSGYFASHHRGASGSSSRNHRNNRLGAEINPQLQTLFARHSQERQESMLDFLGRHNSNSVSPARSLTPVQRDTTGNSRAVGGSRESTPVNRMDMSSPPPPFSPMQSSQQSISTIGNTPSPAPMMPGSPTSYQSARQTQSPRSSRSPSLQPQSPSGSSGRFRSPPPNSINSPIAISSTPRARPRASRTGLRATGSRLGLRSATASMSPAPSQNSFTSGTSNNGRDGSESQNSSATRPVRAGRPLTSEDVRLRGEAVRRAQMANAQQLTRRNSRRELPNANAGGSGGSTAGNNNASRGRRLAAMIGGGSAGARGGGPLLVIGSEDD